MTFKQIFSRTLCLVVVLAFAKSSSAQADDYFHDYILFKGYPYYVSMTMDGEILEFLRTAPEIMRGKLDKNAVPPMPLGPYTKSQGEIAEYISPMNTTTIGDVTMMDTEMEINGKTSSQGSASSTTTQEPGGSTDGGSSDGTVPIVGGNPAADSRPMKTTIVRREKEEEAGPVVINRGGEDLERKKNVYDLKFQGFTARLTPVLINQIKDISNAHKLTPERFIEIRSFVTAGDDTNKKLATNRMRACRDLLETYGVPSDKIDSGIRPYRSSNAGQVSIEFVDRLDNEG